MKRISVREHWLQVSTAGSVDGQPPRVSLSIGQVRNADSQLDLVLGVAEVQALVTMLSEALVDPEAFWDGSHEGTHPVHDPTQNPDALSHRPAIGASPLGGGPLGRSGLPGDEPSL